jgi:hypothetical protein
MTGTFDAYIADQLATQLKQRRIVVWYDSRCEFAPFIGQLSTRVTDAAPVEVEVAGTSAHLVVDDGSRYSTRFRVEPLVAGDEPGCVVIYLPDIKRDHHSSVLMELESAGRAWEPQLRHLARNALRERYTDGVIDELLDKASTTYGDIAAALDSDGDNPPSALKSILPSGTADQQIAAWIARNDLDEDIVTREAVDELRKLTASRLGIELEGEDLAKWRRIVVRTVLGFEFRSDLGATAREQLPSLADASSGNERNASTICDALRSRYGDVYPKLADQAAGELQLTEQSFDAFELGSIDTFRFEERALLRRCGELVRDGAYARVLEVHAERAGCFWLSHDVDRQAQWEAIRLAAELGAAADTVDNDLSRPPRSIAEWVERYAASWHVIDHAQRQLEAWIPKLDDDPDEIAINAVRNRYDATLERLATGFTEALVAANWDTGSVFRQTSIFDLVKPSQGRVAYFLVDAMRYEMGAELAARLQDHAEVSIRPALGVLPSITVIGMAALMPRAAESYNVVDDGGKLQAKVDGVLLPSLQARKKYLAARYPSSIDFELSDVLGNTRKSLEKKVGGAELIVVRSQDIDLFGEGGSSAARTVMNTAIDQLVQAVRKLADIGVGRAVIASDHGHIYASREREEAMRIDAPGGNTVELHRRCWAGLGGATPSAAIRVSATSLGSVSDLDFVFPKGSGVFRAGGDLAFHHGGTSLQELVIPVLSLQMSGAGRADTAPGVHEVSVREVPAEVTTRIFTVKLSFATMRPPPVRLALVADGRQVGAVGMVVGPGVQHDRSSGIVTIPTGVEATIGFVLDDDQVPALRVVVVDPASDAELYRSPADIPVRLGVS